MVDDETIRGEQAQGVDRRWFLGAGASAGLAAVAGGRFGTAGSARAAEVPAETSGLPAKQWMPGHRLMLDDDGGNFLGNIGDDVPQSVADAVRDFPPDVTTYLLCSGSGACIYPSKVGFVSPSAEKCDARGFDPFGLLLRGLGAAGKETFITFRMNDVHNPTEDWNTPRIRREHPDVVVGLDEIKAGKAEWMSYCLDYGRPEVSGTRTRALAPAAVTSFPRSSCPTGKKTSESSRISVAYSVPRKTHWSRASTASASRT